jgi:serine/threonine-protein kinase
MQCPSCHSPVDGSPRFCPACGTSLAAASIPDTRSDPGGSQPSVDPLLGQTLGKYRVIRLLGEGGMGAVYEGEQQLGTSKRRVAIKTLHPHLSRNPQIEARFQREVGTIAELEHPNTIQVYDFGTTPDGILYIVMEFLHGKSLADLLAAHGAMAPDRVAHVLEQVCGSLEEAHAHGIVHRDLKPDNIVLVERAGQKDFVKVLDFGIAKRSREEDKNEQKLTQQGMVLGTPPYMSPEQFTGQPIDARSDIYSLAVMAYEMLTGKLPFTANTAWEWATQHMTQPPIPIESLAEGGRVPLATREALKRALAKAPDQRFQNVREFIDAFEGKGAAPVMATEASGAIRAQKTELGAPIEAAAAYGAPRPGSSPGLAPAHGYTPAAGNMAFPTSPSPVVGIPQPPPPPSMRPSSHRGMLLALAGVIGVASIVAILFATRGARRNQEVVFDSTPSAAPATSLAPAPAGEPAAPTVSAATNTDIPPLSGAAAGAKPAAQHGAPGHPANGAPGHAEPTTATPPAFPTSIPTTLPTTLPTSLPTAMPTQAPTSAAKYDGIECQKARLFKSINRPREAQSWALACIAKGGAP